MYTRASQNENSEFKDVIFTLEIFVPMTQWIIKDENLRPFAIMGEIEKSLKGKKINGLGTIGGGTFAVNFLTEEIASYIQTFYVTIYD